MRAYSKRTLQSAAAATGNGNSLLLQGSGAAALQVTGTFSGTVTFEGHVNEDSATWVALQVVNANSGALSSTATAPGIFYVATIGLHAVRARVSTYASGSITVVGREVDLAIMPPSATPAGTGIIGKVGIDQTTPGTTNLVQVGGTLPAYAAIPAFKVDQTTPGTTNLVQVGGTLPAFAAIPDVKIDQTTPGTTNAVSITTSITGTTVSASQTRPNNATPYTAGDVVGQDPAANITFSNVLSNAAGAFVILGARLRVDVSAIPSGMSGFRLHLYDTAPTAIADNAAYNLPSGDRAKYLGNIYITTMRDLGDTLWGQADSVNMTGKLAAASTSLYGILETVGAFTPTAQAVKTVSLIVAGV